MDSLNKIFSQISTSNSIKSRKALNPISAKRIYFSGPYHRQNWSLPDSIIYYITKNPSTAKLFQKLKENVSNIPLEKLVEALPKLKNLSVNQDFNRYLITSETMKELLKIKHFPQIDVIRFDGLTDTFDIETFYDYMKKNKHTRFSFAFSFSYQLSDAYKNRLEEIIDEVIETQNHDYKVPLFTVPHGDIFKWFKMRELYYSE